MDRVCPLLGLLGDRRSAVDGVDAGHRCHAEDPAVPLDRREQSQLCLTADHTRCERYLQAAARGDRGTPGRVQLGDRLVSTRLLLTPVPAWRGLPGRARRGARGPALVTAGALVALGVGGAAVAAGVMDGGGAMADASTPPSATLVAAASATPRPTASPSPSASPSPVPTVPPTAAPIPVSTAPPTAPPTPAPTPVTYVVQEGDTLAAIAQQFGTTVETLQAANGIEDPNEIVIGQVLVIP